MTATLRTETTQPAPPRPLHILVPLIRHDLQCGDEAARKAGLPYYRAAGEKMLEAKQQIPHGEFQVWVTRNFKISPRQARTYMAYAASIQNGAAAPFSSLNDFRREHLGHASAGGHSAAYKSINETIDSFRQQFKELHDADFLDRAQERQLLRQLKLQMIDIGYRALATKLHPDKGGSPEAMARLNNARDQLKKLASQS